MLFRSEYARAEGGNRAKSARPHCPGKRFSIIGAISLSCIVAVMYIESAVNGSIFKTFIKDLLLNFDSSRALTKINFCDTIFLKNGEKLVLLEQLVNESLFLDRVVKKI